MIDNTNADHPRFFVQNMDEWNNDPENHEMIDENIATREEAEAMVDKYNR